MAPHLEQVVCGGDPIPCGIDLSQPPQREAAQSSALLDLPIHRLPDRLALGVDHGSLPASQLTGHAGFCIGISGHAPVSAAVADRAASDRWPCRRRCPDRCRSWRCPRSSRPHPSSSHPEVPRQWQRSAAAWAPGARHPAVDPSPLMHTRSPGRRCPPPAGSCSPATTTHLPA